MKQRAGELTMIVGGMFSGKSTELQRQGKRNELAGRSVLYFKPAKDTRYKKGAVSTHDGSNVTAHSVGSSHELLKFVEPREVNVVCIDEVQFFDKDIVRTVNILLMKGIDVVCSGLDLDRFGQPFGEVPQLLCLAEHVTKLNAVCQSCGGDAWVSFSETENKEQVVLGEKDIYIPLCRSCYYRKGNVI